VLTPFVQLSLICVIWVALRDARMNLTHFKGSVSGCLFLTFFLSLVAVSGQTGTNFWTKTSSGYWEEPFWSLGQMPNHDQAGVALNNPGWKALAIGANTTANFPNSLSIKNLLVESPVDSANQLLLNYAGPAVPLRIDTDLRIAGTNSSIVSYYSALKGANLYLGGAATFDQLSEAAFSTQVAVGFDGSAAQLTVLGGSILNAGSLSINYWATGGVAAVNMYSGAINASNIIEIGLGNVGMSGGNFRSAGINVFSGELRQSGGTNQTGSILLPHNRQQNGQGNYYLSGGTLLSSNLSLGDANPGGFTYYNGVFEQSGGVHTNSGGIVTWGVSRSAAHSISGTYRLSAGLLVTPSIQHFGGGFEQSGGTNRAGNITVGEEGTFLLSAGALSSSNTAICCGFGDPYYYRELRSFYTQTGGGHDVQLLFSSGHGAVASLQGGWLRVPDVSVGPDGELGLNGAAITNSGTFSIFGGSKVYANGNYPQLGKLVVQSGSSVLDFESGATTLRFQDSHTATWDSSALLTITNWSGFANGAGTDRLYVGTSSQGLTRAQLDHISFVNPPSFPPGSYPAVILATGEVVPTARPIVSMTHTTNRMVMSWSGNYQLWSSTNVTGPYSIIIGAASPYTNSFSEPRRFFYLRSP
jgi:hypothetical protein